MSSPSMSASYATGGNPLSGGNFNYNGTNISSVNPYMMNPSQLNPAAAGYASQLAGLQSNIANMSPGSQYYSQMQAQQGQQLNTSLNNQYAAMGLSGSSALGGALSQADIQNSQAWQQRQFQQSLQSSQAQAGLIGAQYGETTGIQGQALGYENDVNQSIANLLSAQQQGSEANNQLWAGLGQSLLGAGGSIGGGMAAGGTGLFSGGGGGAGLAAAAI